MEPLDYTEIKSLGITKQACERYTVPQVKTRSGIKLGAVFSPECTKILNLDGSYYWDGDYDPNLGLFGQRACVPGEPLILVAAELEALKLGSLGFNAVCLAEPKQVDSLCLSILEETLITVSSEVAVWTETTFGKRQKALEKFLLHLAGSKRFTVLEIDGSNVPLLSTAPNDIKAILDPLETRPWKPRGIKSFSDIVKSKDFHEPVKGVSSGYDCIDRFNNGLRTSEVVMFTAGSGVGKSTIVREIAYHLGTKGKRKVGMIFLEEKEERTAKCLAAIKHNIPIEKLRMNPSLLTQKQWDDFANNKDFNNNFEFMCHFGSLDSDELFSKIDYLIDFWGAEFICLDHISILVSGMSSKEGERKDIDILMTRLATTAVAKNVGFLCISHLSKPDGSPHEEGGRVTLSDLRGSGSIKQLSASIYALERNQQDPDSTLALIRQLKARETGRTGPCGVVKYSPETGRLLEDKAWCPNEFEQMLRPRRSKGSPGMYNSPRQQGAGFGGISGY